MIFGGITKTSTIDFPGVLACVLFTKACNLDCFYCHNRLLIDSCAAEGAAIPALDEADVKAFLSKRRGLLDGVAISGGEPTLQPDLLEFAAYVKALGYKVKLDTNGMFPRIVKEALELRLFDYVAVDYKARASDYEAVCAGKAAYVHEAIGILLQSGLEFEVRTTVYPGMTADILKELVSEIPVAPRYRLNVYKPPKTYPERYAPLLERDFLSSAELELLLPELRSAQPGICVA